jgi:hypothetical protein
MKFEANQDRIVFTTAEGRPVGVVGFLFVSGVILAFSAWLVRFLYVTDLATAVLYVLLIFISACLMSDFILGTHNATIEFDCKTRRLRIRSRFMLHSKEETLDGIMVEKFEGVARWFVGENEDVVAYRVTLIMKDGRRKPVGDWITEDRSIHYACHVLNAAIESKSQPQSTRPASAPFGTRRRAPAG